MEPTINSVQTTNANLMSFTLLNSSSFNYNNFDVWVAVNNTGDTYDNKVALTLNQAGNTTAVVPTVLQSITTNAGSAANSVTLVEFNVQGATSGEVLDVGAAGPSRSTLSAVSFESVAAPEPSVSSLLLLGGLGLLVFFRFRAVRA